MTAASARHAKVRGNRAGCYQMSEVILEEPYRSQTLGFGKHRGLPWKDVPTEYLEWLAGQASPTAGIIRNRHARMARMEIETRTAHSAGESHGHNKTL